MLVLKKSSYAVRLYKLHGGDDATFDTRMKDSNREAVKLHITQRLPWAANNLMVSARTCVCVRTRVQEKFGDAHDNGAQYYLAVPNNDQPMRVTELTPKPMGGLVQYLDEKQAAGVVTLCAGVCAHARTRAHTAQVQPCTYSPNAYCRRACSAVWRQRLTSWNQRRHHHCYSLFNRDQIMILYVFACLQVIIIASRILCI